LYRRAGNDNWKYPLNATNAAREALKQQVAEMDELQAEDHGFIANPIRTSLAIV